MNWIDIVFVIAVLLFAYQGYKQGMIAMLIELAAHILTYILAFKFGYLGEIILKKYTSINLIPSYESIIGILLVWIILSFAYYLLVPLIIKAIPPVISKSSLNRLVGLSASTLKGLIIISLIIFVLSLIPFNGQLKNDFNKSPTVQTTLNITKEIVNKIAGNIYDKISFDIPHLGMNNESVDGEKLIYLGFKTTNVSVNKTDEEIMFNYVNEQRKKNNLKELKLNQSITKVAESYGIYMFANGFFSHITPSKQTPADRINLAHINYISMGENIAKAPDVNTADTGLMNSPEHKENILNPNFTEVGIGVINAGFFGKIFVQDFIGY